MKKKLLSILLAVCLLLGFVPGLTPAAAAAEPEPVALEYTLPYGDTISAGSSHIVVIKEDGTLWGWGNNVSNELGVGALAEPVLTPMQIPVDNVVSVRADDFTTAVLKSNGELWNWGSHDANGKLGREAEGDNIGPGKVMDNVVQLSSGASHSVAVTRDGTMWVWGSNDDGQLGNGGKDTGFSFDSLSGEYSYEPLPVRVLEDVRMPAAGGGQTFAILNDGSLWAWGANDRGQLCNMAPGEEDASLLGVKTTRTYEVKEEMDIVDADGTVWHIHPGIKESTHIYQPTPIKVMENVEKVATDFYTIVLKTDGSVWTCGSLGKDIYSPEHVLDGAVDVAVGGGAFAAIKEDGSLWTWGQNAIGQLGRGSCSLTEWEPAKVMDDVVSVTVGNEFMAALKSDGSLWAWGTNYLGQLGVGNEDERLSESSLGIKYSAEPIQVMDGVALPGRAGELGAAELPSAGETTADRAGTTSVYSSVRAAANTGAGAVRMQIPSNAFYINGNAFCGYNCSGYTWEEAEAYCESLGGHLATLATYYEEGLYFTSGAMFLGARRNPSTGQFYWITGEPSNIGSSTNPACNYLMVESDGSLVGTTNNYPAQGFICEWETRRMPGAVYTVYFNPAGGTVSTDRKQVTNGKTYGTLPTPTRPGYTFAGWSVSDSDSSTLVNANTTVSLSGDRVLYALWSDGKGGPEIGDVSYSFGNNNGVFGYSSNYRIPLERYTYLFGDSMSTKRLYDSVGYWDGNCFGMVTSSTLLYMGGNWQPSPQLQLTGTMTLDSSGKSYTLKEYIEIMQVLQYSADHQRVENKNTNAYTNLVSAVVNFENTGAQPVFIGIYGPTSGHELLGLGASRDTANKRDLIHVYDPNFPLDNNRYLYIYWNDAGYYTGWYYHLNDKKDWGSSYGGDLDFSTYTDVLSVWGNRGSQAALNASIMSVSTSNASIYDYDGNLAATIRDGEITSNRADLFAFKNPISGSANGTENGVSLWVPTEYFTVVNEDENAGELSVTVTGRNSSVAVSTSADRATVYTDSDSGSHVALVNGKGEHYEMVFTSGGAEEVRLTGTVKEDTPTCFARLSGELSGMGVGGAELSVEGKAASLDQVAQTTAVSIVTSTAPSAISSVFPDVPRDAGYAPAVQWAYDNSITGGTELGFFSPERTCTRAEALTFLWRALGCPVSTASVQPFADVQESDYFYEAAVWAAGSGVALGTDAAHFSPSLTCTDEQFLTFLWRALDKPGQRTGFAGYDNAVEWAREQGLLQDTDSQPPCLRRDAVTFLYRALA